MFTFSSHPKDFFAEGFRALLGTVLVLGFSLLLLGGLIFVFPELIGFLIAALILAGGIAVLYWAWQIWKFKKHISEIAVEHPEEPFVYEVRGEGPHYRYRRVTMIMR